MFRFNVLHFNDANSELVSNVARFTTVLRREQSRGPSLSLSAGNNLGAGAQFEASREKGVPYYDALALEQMGLQASGVGPGEFYYGPDTFARFLAGTSVPFLAANLSGPGLTPSKVVSVDGRSVLLVGVTTPAIRTKSTPQGVTIEDDLVGSVQREIDASQSRANIVVLLAHLQGIGPARELVGSLRGVDVVVASGAELPDSVQSPAFETAADGHVVPVVTTGGGYRFLGRLGVTFDEAGRLLAVDDTSGQLPVEGVEPDPVVLRTVEEPLRQQLAAQATEIVGSTEVLLNGEEAELQAGETNLGNFLADALLAEARRLEPSFGVAPAQVALLNSGAVNINGDLAPGPLTRLNFNEMLPFPSLLVTVPDVPAALLKQLLENSVSESDGRFAQVAGLTLVWDPAGTPQRVDEQGNVVVAGTRVREVALTGGPVLVTGGQVVPGSPSVSVATLDFVARGGDEYPFGAATFVPMGEDYGSVARRFLREQLAGVVRAAQYPVGGTGRITRL